MGDAFIISITPERMKKPQTQEDKEPTKIVLGCFQGRHTVVLENVPVGKTARRVLHIENPCHEEVQILVTKLFKPEFNVTFEWIKNTIPPHEMISLEVVWNPTFVIASKEVLQLTDSLHGKTDISFVFKSIKKNPITHAQPVKCLRHSSISLMEGARPKPTNIPTSQRNHLSALNLLVGHNDFPLADRNKKFEDEIKKVAKRIPSGSVSLQKGNKENLIPSLADEHSQSVPLRHGDIFKNSLLTPVSLSEKFDAPISPSKTFLIQEKVSDNNCEGDIFPLNFKENLPDQVQSDLRLSMVNEARLSVAPVATLGIDDSVNDMKIFEPDICSTVTKKTIPHKDSFLGGEDNVKKIENENFYSQPSEPTVFEENPTESDVKEFNRVFNRATTTRQDSYHQLSVINEEERSQDYTFSIGTELQQTYRITQEDSRIIHQNRSDGNTGATSIETTPLRKHSESLVDLSQKIQNPSISANQGSMPNLSEMRKINSIENNRYYYQDRPGIYSNVSDNSTASSTSVVSTADEAFNQREILAQSSVKNLYRYTKTTVDKSSILKYAKSKILDNSSSSPTSPSTKCTPRRRSNSISEGVNSAKKNDFNPRSSYLVITPPRRPKLPRTENIGMNAKFDEMGSRYSDASFANKDGFKLTRSCQSTNRSFLDVLMNANRDPTTSKLYDIDMYMQTCINPDPFAATTTFDPFLARCVYLDNAACKKYEIQMKKWLNALVSIPQELNLHNHTIDVGSLFNEVRKKQMVLAPTKEEVSMNYLTASRMDHLRGAGIKLFMSPELRDPCSKVAIHIKKGTLRVRRESNPHLDVVLQKTILGLLLSFNPIWLRIGLEVVFGEIIHLNSNADIVGLSSFIINRLLKRKGKERNCSKAYTLTGEYAEEVTQFILQKILFLLIFLDKAKGKNLIKHNPCLFMKSSPYKETKDVLLKVSTELIAGVGDIVRELKRFGYVLTHKQTPLDEFNYAFENLAVDLRDGVRLVRVVEVIVMRTDLTAQLRYPAISRLQKVANVNLALKALKEANFTLTGVIQAGEIVDGHKEKTLSLLWQIIYNFRAPKFNSSAALIQKWWRKISLKVFIRRKIREKIELKRNKSATVIQAAFRGYRIRKYTRVLKEEKTKAAICFQKHCRMYLARRKFQKIRNCAIRIQNWYRQVRITKSIRSDYLSLRKKVIKLQTWYRRILLARKLEISAPLIKQFQLEARNRYEKAVILQRSLKSYIVRRKLREIVYAIVTLNRKTNVEYRSATKIQSFLKMLPIRKEFQMKRNNAIIIQKYWRSYQLTKELKSDYSRKRKSIITIQRYFRNYLEKKSKREDFLRLKFATIAIQRRFRAKKMMVEEKRKYLLVKKSVLLIQEKFRATLVMKKTRQEYLNARSAIINLQLLYRARNLMKIQRSQYLARKAATIKIQRWYRSLILMRKERSEFHLTRNKIILIQRKWRATLLSRKMRLEFVSLQYNVILMQQRFRANRLMKSDREKYVKLQEATQVFQRRFRAIMAMRQAQKEYLSYRNAIISLQRRFRANSQMLEERKRFNELKCAALVFQRKFRANKLMKQNRSEYIRLRNSVLIIQQKYRAILLSRTTVKYYQNLKKATIVVQRRFRANIAMRKSYNEYNNTREKLITIQRWIRNCLEMRKERSRFLQMKVAACKIQHWYRGILKMREIRCKYEKMIGKIRFIQTLWRSKLQMRQDRQKFVEKRNAAIKIQQYFRSYKLTKQCRSNFILLKKKVTLIQEKYRAKLIMIKQRNEFLKIKTVAIYIQRKFRAKQAMQIERRKFLRLRCAAIFIQQKYRGRFLTRIKSEEFQRTRHFILRLQTRARGLLARRRYTEMLTPERKEIIRQRKAAKIIQKFYRGWVIRKKYKCAKLKRFRQRLRELEQKAKLENTVRHKIKQALGFLRGRHPINELLANLKFIENISRFLPQALADYAHEISIYCYGTMVQAIRSEYDKLIIERCSCIILNLIRYDKFNIKEYIKEDWFVTIAQMLLRWCDKDCEIFNALCTLIWILTRDSKKKEKIRCYMSTHEAIYMIREIKKLVIRKENMRRNIRKYNSSSSSSMENRRMLPFLKPDYGFIGKQPYIFNCSVFAFETVLKVLQISV